MLQKASLAFRLNMMILALLLVTCIAVIAINATLSRRAMEREIQTRTLPAMAADVVASVDRKLVAPATTLGAMAQHPMFIDWILKGEDPALVPMVYQASRNIANMHNAGNVNVVIRESLNYYSFDSGQENTKKVSPQSDGWFFDFEKGGASIWVNIHAPNDEHYPNQAFINRRIDNNGKFLGIVSTGMSVADFNRELAGMRIGSRGSTFLVRKSGEIMLHPDVSLNGSMFSAMPGFSQFAAEILRRGKFSFETQGGNGQRILVAAQEIPILDAVVVTQADAAEMLLDINKATYYSAGAGLILLLAGYLLSRLFVRGITMPLKQLIAYAGDIASGRPAKMMPEQSGAEISELRSSLNAMVQSLDNQLVEVQNKSVEADHQTAVAREALEKSRQHEQQVSDLVANILRVSREAEDIAEEVAASSKGCADELGAVSAQIMSNDERIVEVAKAMGRMQEQVSAMTVSAANAAERAEQANSSAKKGERTLGQAIEAIDDVNHRTEELRTSLESLGAQAASIGQILTVITNIADQTNMLALNAAIEAARAGDAGRGFAVVADEVRNLAEKTMQATHEVDMTIKDIQKATTASIAGMGHTTASVEEATRLARESGTDLSEIVVQVNESSSRVGDITTAVHEQSETTGIVLKSVEASRDTTSRAIGDMERVSRSVQNLAVRANDLRVLVEELARKG